MGERSSHDEPTAAKVPEFVYAESRAEAQRLLDESYLTKYRAMPLTLPPLGPLHVRQGNNQYEWHVYEGSVSLATWPTQQEAMAFMAGYGRGYERDV